MQITGLGAMRLIDEHEDCFVLVQHFEGLGDRLDDIGRSRRILHARLFRRWPVLPAFGYVVLDQARLTGSIGVTVLLNRGEQ